MAQESKAKFFRPNEGNFVEIQYISLMKQRRGIALDFVIDKLTNSVENVHTGDSFATEITLLSSADVKTISQKNGWLFDWKYELKQPAREVYKLTIVHNPAII